jgi:uncharacterized protein YxeA
LKKIFVVLSIILILLVTIALYIAKKENIDYTSLSKNQLPSIIQEKLQKTSDGEKFNIYYDEKLTYVVYKAEHKTNEYTTTALTLTKQNRKYIVNAVIDIATDESNVSYYKIISFKKVPKKDIELIEIDRR